MAVAELLQSEKKYHFVIPSFQRGYRWEEKQVLDLLNDLKQFADDDNRSNDRYFLQPLVVKSTDEENTWEVIDGQQRLTTMLLILNRLMKKLSEDDRDYFSGKLYDIKYTNRPQLDFENPNAVDNIDSFYLFEAKATIDNWFNERKGKNLDGFKGVLLFGDNPKQTKFIWYAIDDKYVEVDSINIFNRLNNGKIGLTSAELIKALFILDSKYDVNIDEKTLAIEWDFIERRLQDDSLWHFICNDSQSYQTRIDLLFDFVTNKPHGEDSDFSYRKFQNLFNYCKTKNVINDDSLDSLWKGYKVFSLEDAWKQVKIVFDNMLAWYEDSMFYHYIGFLIAEGDSPLSIHIAIENAKKDKTEEWTIDDTKQVLHALIREKFKVKNTVLTTEDIRALEYNSSTLVRRTLLLFNVETCLRSNNLRFAFDKYKKEKWDIEHINSQNEATLQRFEDRIKWMKAVGSVLAKEPGDEAKILLNRNNTLLSNFQENGQVDKQEYNTFYVDVNNYYTPGEDSVHKDSIGNLTLLDSSTNREYQDAPYPYKRQCIIKKDMSGETFIPVCTRNLFLKYYTDKETDHSQFDMMRWTNNDMECYLNHMISTIEDIFTAKEKGEKENEQ